MNGTRMLRPGERVLWYRPSRSTTPAVACGMMRIARAIVTITKMMTAITRIQMITVGMIDASSTRAPSR